MICLIFQELFPFTEKKMTDRPGSVFLGRTGQVTPKSHVN